jgi:hypothetical protein
LNNPYSGQGGSYVIDLDTGQVNLVERTQEAGSPADQAPATPDPAPAGDTTPAAPAGKAGKTK